MVDNTNYYFNPDLVAVVGNQSSGKSALTDILGLLRNYPYRLGSFVCHLKLAEWESKTKIFIA